MCSLIAESRQLSLKTFDIYVVKNFNKFAFQGTLKKIKIRCHGDLIIICTVWSVLESYILALFPSIELYINLSPTILTVCDS